MAGKVDHLFVRKEDSIRTTMERLEANKPSETGILSGLALVVDAQGRLEGIATDGDIRRGLVHGKSMEDSVGMVANKKPFYIEGGKSPLAVMSTVLEKNRESQWDRGRLEKIVVVDADRRPIDIISIYDVWKSSDIRFKRIGIVGLGYVGLTLGLTLADLGFDVRGLDVSKSVSDSIKAGKPHFYEKGLHELLADHLGKKFQVTDSFEGAGSCDVYFVAVGTPLDAKKKPSLDFIKGAAVGLGKVIKQGDLVVLRSTVPIGTTREVVVPLLEKHSKLRAGDEFLVAFAPERTIEGKAIEELRHLPQVIGGFNHASTELTSNVFSFMTKSTVVLDSLEEAEMVKLVNNTYRDVTFGFANEVSLIARGWGIDGKKVIEAANFGYERSRVPFPSPGVGGYCLEKDPYILSQSALRKEHVGAIITRGREVSERILDALADDIVSFLRTHKRGLADAKIFIIGFAFKGRPATSDVRGSTTYALIDRLKKKKIRNIHGFDPFVHRDDIAKRGAEHVQDVKKGVEGADVVVVMNNNLDFESIDMRALLVRRTEPVLLLDTWSLYSSEELSKLSHVVHKKL